MVIVIGIAILVAFRTPVLWSLEYYAEYFPFSDDRGARLVGPLAFLAVIIGVFLILYGIAVLVGKAGKYTIIEQGSPKQEQLAQSP